MFYNLFSPGAGHIVSLNLVRYITFRTMMALLTALLISFLCGPRFIAWLRKLQKEGQPIRDDGPASHLVTKVGTPTMGGGLMLIAIAVATLLWADLSNIFVWVTLGVTLGYGALGYCDDYLKLTKRNTKGVPGKVKLLVQFGIALLAIVFIIQQSPDSLATAVVPPFFKTAILDLSYFYLAFAGCVIVGSSNAVNLTDGLDGLAIVPVMIAAACFAIISYLVGHLVFANYLQLNHIPGTGELSVFCGALVGAGLGFLWYNAPPAMVFMGDTGSLAIGGALGVVSVITKHEFVLAIIGGLFVIEAVSVIIQVFYFKRTGKRVFLMAPIHHHFEKLGWSEPTVVIRFWIISVVFALAGLSTLKIR